MKSIDEFATEYAQDKYLPVQTSQAVKAGANAVLKEIKRYIQQATQEHEVGLVWISGLINLINELEGKNRV